MAGKPPNFDNTAAIDFWEFPGRQFPFPPDGSASPLTKGGQGEEDDLASLEVVEQKAFYCLSSLWPHFFTRNSTEKVKKIALMTK